MVVSATAASPPTVWAMGAQSSSPMAALTWEYRGIVTDQ